MIEEIQNFQKHNSRNDNYIQDIGLGEGLPKFDPKGNNYNKNNTKKGIFKNIN